MSQTSVKKQRSPDTAAELDVELRKVFKVFNGETAVRGIDLSVRRGEFFSILGPSGCGKTTTLRLVAGFDLPSAGEVLIQGQSMNQVPPHRRPVNTVFQSYALFSHLSVVENIAFGLRLKKLKAAEVDERVKQALKQVKMEAYAKVRDLFNSGQIEIPNHAASIKQLRNLQVVRSPNGNWNVTGGNGSAVDDYASALAGAVLCAERVDKFPPKIPAKVIWSR